MISESAVLLITFNRSEYTKKVLQQIKESKIKKVYISNDAPRDGNDIDFQEREKIRNLIDEIDWSCELHTLFFERNMGCGKGPSAAISWAFEKEDQLIILEDDCVPSLAFFPYCNEMLNLYSNDTRVWKISGRSHHPDSQHFEGCDYLFTHYGHTCGWATWKRCWEHFDINMSDFPSYLKGGGGSNIYLTKEEALFSNYMLSQASKDNKLSSHVWDIQFDYTTIKNGGLSIVPRKNLIENIGYIGTHFNKVQKYNLLKYSENFHVVNHPHFLLSNGKYDFFHFNHTIRKFHFLPCCVEILFRKMKKLVK